MSPTCYKFPPSTVPSLVYQIFPEHISVKCQFHPVYAADASSVVREFPSRLAGHCYCPMSVAKPKVLATT